MAFFGLSALGPQSALAAGRIEGDAYTVSLFTADEFRAAWAREAGSAAAPLPPARVAAVLARVFRGPAPAAEEARVLAAAAARAAADGDAGALSFDGFLAVVAALAAGPPPPVSREHAHYTSYEEFRAHRLLERRPVAGPADLLVEPRTAGQAIGFEAHKAVPHKIHFVKMSDVTRFKSDLIKAGVLY